MNAPTAPYSRHATWRRLSGGALVAVVLLVGMLPAVRAEPPRIFALTHANVVPSPGTVVEDGTVLLRDGLIAAVGADVKIPSDAVEIDTEGGWIYAGLIDVRSGIGLSATEEPRERGPRTPSTLPGAVHPVSRVRPETRARDALLPFEGSRLREMQRVRNLGFTAVLVAPEKGVLRGRSVAIQLLDERPVTDLILRDDVAQHAALEHGRFGDGYPTSLMGAVATIRQSALDARRQATWGDRYRTNPQDMHRPEFHAAFAALAPVVAGEQALWFAVEDPLDVLLAHRIGLEFDLELVIAASGHEWEIAEQVAATGRPLVLPLAAPDKPDVGEQDEALDVSRRKMRRYLDSATGPGRLHRAGVRFALTTHGLKNTADFPKRMRKIIEAGLPQDIALAALTTVPAELLGLERSIGTLEPGKIANVVVSSGPLFDGESKPHLLFVDGIRYEVETPDKPRGDPDAVVDPRGVWSVAFDMGSRSFQRTWTISGKGETYSGTAETQSGEVDLDSVTLAGNALTVVYPARGGRAMEVTVIIEGDSFDGTAQMGPRSVEIHGTRTSGPEGSL